MFPHPRVGREGSRQGSEEGAPRPSTSASASDHVHAPARTRSTVERLSLVEVMVAELGGWAGAIFYRCHLPAGPFLASDGGVHLDLAVFCGETQERAEPSAPE
jgi:hypothetical protein